MSEHREVFDSEGKVTHVTGYDEDRDMPEAAAKARRVADEDIKMLMNKDFQEFLRSIDDVFK